MYLLGKHTHLYTLVGPTRQDQVQDPPSVPHLDNQLYILNYLLNLDLDSNSDGPNMKLLLYHLSKLAANFLNFVKFHAQLNQAPARMNLKLVNLSTKNGQFINPFSR